MRRKRRENNEAEDTQFTPSFPEVVGPRAIPFVQRFTCTINEACEVTGLGRTSLTVAGSPSWIAESRPSSSSKTINLDLGRVYRVCRSSARYGGE
jgi:hypothetical protein